MNLLVIKQVWRILAKLVKYSSLLRQLCGGENEVVKIRFTALLAVKRFRNPLNVIAVRKFNDGNEIQDASNLMPVLIKLRKWEICIIKKLAHINK